VEALLVALLLAAGGGHAADVSRVSFTEHGVVVQWDSPAPGEGWVWVETTKRGSLRIDTQQEDTASAK